jgi:hypothetical protein
MEHSRNFQDLTGQKIHRLTFIEYVGKNYSRNAIWKVRCDCGTIFNVLASSVKHGTTYSCGCLRIEMNKKRKNTNIF